MMSQRGLSLQIRCMFHLLLIGDSVLKVQTSPLYVYAGTTDGRIPFTDDVTSFSVIDCSRRCTVAVNCQIFYYERDTKLCRLVTSVFTDGTSASMDYQNAGGTLDLHYRPGTQSLLTSVTACPATSGEETTIVTPWSELTFWAYTETKNYTQAWEACTSQGLVLMKINTPEKQAAVRHVLNTCPVLSPNQFWLDGFLNTTSGVWQFADGSLVPMGTTHFWHSGRPDDPESCIRTRSGHKWDDRPCYMLRAYICEA